MPSSTSSSDPRPASAPAGWPAIAITLVVALSLVWINQALDSRTGTPTVAENNSQAVLLKIQQYEFATPRPPAVLVGSSISGRIDVDVLTRAGVPTANLGLDGLAPAYGLDVVLAQENLPRYVIVEVNTAAKPVGANADVITEMRDSLSFDLAEVVPAMRVDARPTTQLYAELRSRRNDGRSAVPPPVPASLELAPPGAAPDSRPEVVAVERAIGRLETAGVEVVLVAFPTGQDDADAVILGRELSGRTGIPLIDLTGVTDAPEFYTDGVHLTPAASEAVASALAEVLLASIVSPS